MGGKDVAGHVTECPGHGNLATVKSFQGCSDGTTGIAELVQISVQIPSIHKNVKHNGAYL